MCRDVNQANTIMSLICPVTQNLVVECEEEGRSLLNIDNTLLFLKCSVNLDLTDVVTKGLYVLPGPPPLGQFIRF